MESLVLAALFLLLASPFLNSWRKRARRRRELRDLLKDGFRSDRSFVRNAMAIETVQNLGVLCPPLAIAERGQDAMADHAGTGRV